MTITTRRPWPYDRHYICINCSIPVGKNNRYGHPNKEVLDNLKKSKIYRTDKDKRIKTMEENDKVGIIICRQDNEYVIKYCSDDRIIAREYELVWYNNLQGENILW